MLKGGDGQAIHRVAADPRDPDLLYAAGEGGVFRSPDGGRSWLQVLELRMTAEGDVTVGPEGEVWAGGPGAGVVASRDGISGWTLLPGLDALFLRLEADPHHPSTVYAAADAYFSVGGGGLFRRRDG